MQAIAGRTEKVRLFCFGRVFAVTGLKPMTKSVFSDVAAG